MSRISLFVVIQIFTWTVLSQAGIVQISEPDAAYQAATTKIDISALGYNSQHEFITDGTLQVTFSSPMLKRGPVPRGWTTWSAPPFSENATPDVLASNGATSMTWTFDRTVGTFGFELEPNLFQDQEMTVDFVFSLNNVIVGTIQRTVNGQAGARLFAAKTTDVPFNRIDIMGGEFAVAQIRYALLNLVTIDVRPGDEQHVINLMSRGVVPVAIKTTRAADGDANNFDVSEVNPSTLQLGPAQAGALHWSFTDIDADGDLDLLVHFKVQELGLSCGETEVTLLGATYSGVPIIGVESIQTKGCNGNARGQNLRD